MRLSLTNKMALIVSLIVFLTISILAIFNYRSSYQEVLQAAGVELTGCANITTGIIDPEALQQLVSGERSYLNQIEDEIEWTIGKKDIFEAHYILSLDGKVLAADSNLRSQGFQAGDTFMIDEEAIEHVKAGHSYYTDVYEFGGITRVTGYAPIFQDHNPQNEVIAINTIDFEGSIVRERTWEMAKPTLIIAIILPFLAAIVTIIIIRKMTKPIQLISSHVNKVAKGSLNIQPLSISNKDDLGALADDVNQMVASLQQVIAGVAENAQLIAATSEQLFASAEDTSFATDQIHMAMNNMAAGVEQQSQSTQNANQNITNIAKHIHVVSTQIEQAAQASNDTDQVSKNGREVVNQTIQQMNNIKDNTNQMGKIANQLNIKAKEIDKIVTLITSISEQTNLLALNASIEAARAGEHGLGFSIVAEEVRKLAEETGQATEQVSNLIKDLQSEAIQSVDQTSHAQLTVEQGIDLIYKTNGAFTSISSTASKTAQQLHQLTIDINKSKQQMQDLVKEVDGMTEIAEQSSGSTEKIAKSGKEQKKMMEDIFQASKALATISEKLQYSIDQFKY
ncbi:methyl-accepting chemotaxis protein [Amphibacillus cookii]|uniref:methyl-accepting chemotaxis protein n=1 Tax=Amphibacillus cookii TaxID=767787 RepID=UPI00195E6DCF|nr:methyl-accepting chemotaxis protein [Amphibacillus cookii]MBM7540772.1 methyl-accepting chemotaxis protein [Amphibacillus cookii]